MGFGVILDSGLHIKKHVEKTIVTSEYAEKSVNAFCKDRTFGKILV
jgi:hypothetical protein